MNFSIQQELSNENVVLKPLKESDFEVLFSQAADEEVWNQHPNKNRYKREVFEIFFEGALESQGAFAIIDKPTNQIIGSTRFYDFIENENSIFIGYTFYGKAFWGKNYNSQVKKLMLDYIFRFVDFVNFHVGNENFRSQKAMEKLGAENLGNLEIAYFGEETRTNILYRIKKEDWVKTERNLILK